MGKIALVWAEGLNAEQLEDLREAVDSVLSGEKEVLVTNFKVHWENVDHPSDTEVNES